MARETAAGTGGAGESGGPSKLGAGVRRAKRWVIRTIAILTFAVILALAVWTWIALSFAYAHGERAGYIQTLSKQGWVFKTWEGELAMVNLPGAMPEIFRFSVRDDAIAAQLQETLGHRVRIYYEEHVGVPVNWFAESQYYVVRAEIIPDEPSPR